MKPTYSFRVFLIGTVVLGSIAALVMERLSPAPIKLSSVSIGELSDDPSKPIEELTLDEVRNAINLERKTLGPDFSGSITELKVLAVTTSLDSPRSVPLIGNARLRHATFRCSVKVVHSDGSVASKLLLVEKNAFRLMKN